MARNLTMNEPSTKAGLTKRITNDGLLVVLVVMSGVIIAGLAVLPLRTWLDQRQLIAETEQELAEVQGEVDDLEAQANLLETDAEVERLARENFDLVFPGEESYRILPPVEG